MVDDRQLREYQRVLSVQVVVISHAGQTLVLKVDVGRLESADSSIQFTYVTQRVGEDAGTDQDAEGGFHVTGLDVHAR